MSMGTSDLVVVTPPATTGSQSSYLEWGPVLGGGVLSAAITMVMAAFGSALGLSLVSAETGRTSSLALITIAGGLWLIWITVSACFAGGYLAGRMRRPVQDSASHERDVRDGAHGLLVWAVGALIATMIASSSLLGVAKTAVNGAAAAANSASSLLSQQADPLGTAVDSVMRSTGENPPTAEERQEASRILVTAMTTGTLDPADRDYLASRIAARTGVAQPEAQARVDAAYTKLQQAKEEAKKAAEKARKAAIVTAFLTAAVLLLGAATAWFAAQMGGRHRDENSELNGFFGR